MTDFERNPRDAAGDDRAREPKPAELDLPGPDDPVAWSYVQPGTTVVGREGEKIGKVSQMLGTEAEGIFHGIALDPARGGPARVISANDVTGLTPSQVSVRISANDVDALEPWHGELPG